MVPRSAAIYLGVVQFLFATTWTIYVIYLPQLAAKAGIAKEWVPWIIVADQLVFALTDVVTGFWVDRVRRGLARIGGWILAVTSLSCAAFLVLPFAGASPAVLLALIAVWAVTSSALRSPTWALLGRYAAKPSVPRLSALVLTGTAIAGAIGPYLGVTLREVDPRIPFALSSLALLATVGGLVWVERRLAGAAPQPAGESEPPFDFDSAEGRRLVYVFFAALVLMAVGFQVHFALNSAGQYLRYASPAELPYLMPIFWIGFNVMMFPASTLVQRHGAVAVMTAAGAAGAIATLGSVLAPGLTSLSVAQFLAGGCWGAMSMASYSAAIAFGRSRREGALLGSLFAVLALAAFLRVGAFATGIAAQAPVKALLPWLPHLGWLVAALMLAALLGAARRRAV